MACGSADGICVYKATEQVMPSFERCEMVGQIVGGGLLSTPIGRFEAGNVTVTCRPLVAPVRPSGRLAMTFEPDPKVSVLDGR